MLIPAERSELTLARLDRCFDEPIPNPGRRVAWRDMKGGSSVPGEYEIAVDFMDMTNDRHLWARAADARPDLELSVGRHVVVGDEDADPKVARIVAVDADGNVELEVLPGSVESHSDLLAPA
jgi:hypothetical protein